MFEFLEVFTSYYNRLYTSETGVKSQRWLYDEILDVSIVLIFSVSHTTGNLLLEPISVPRIWLH